MALIMWTRDFHPLGGKQSPKPSRIAPRKKGRNSVRPFHDGCRTNTISCSAVSVRLFHQHHLQAAGKVGGADSYEIHTARHGSARFIFTIPQQVVSAPGQFATVEVAHFLAAEVIEFDLYILRPRGAEGNGGAGIEGIGIHGSGGDGGHQLIGIAHCVVINDHLPVIGSRLVKGGGEGGIGGIGVALAIQDHADAEALGEIEAAEGKGIKSRHRSFQGEVP